VFPRTKVDCQLLCMKEIHRSERRLGEEVESPPFCDNCSEMLNAQVHGMVVRKF
jgi:hypothetical protein